MSPHRQFLLPALRVSLRPHLHARPGPRGRPDRCYLLGSRDRSEMIAPKLIAGSRTGDGTGQRSFMHILGAHTEPPSAGKQGNFSRGPSLPASAPVGPPSVERIHPWPRPVLHARWNLASVRLSRLAAITTKLSSPTTRATRHVPRCGRCHGYHTPRRPPLPCSWNSPALCLAHPTATASALEPHPGRWDRGVEPSSSGGDGPCRASQDPTSTLYATSHGAVTAPGPRRRARSPYPPRTGEYPVRATATAAGSSRHPCTSLSSLFPTSVRMPASLQVLTFFHPCPCLLGPVGLARV